MAATKMRMHTINANVVQDHSYENLSHESFIVQKFPDVRYSTNVWPHPHALSALSLAGSKCVC